MAMVALMAIVTHSRATEWHSSIALWSAEIKTDPRSLRAHINLGSALEKRGDLYGAGEQAALVVSMSRTARISPWIREFAWSAGMSNFAHAAILAGDLNQARITLDALLREHPEFPNGHYNYGLLLMVEGRCDEAMKEFAIAQSSDHALIGPTCRD